MRTGRNDRARGLKQVVRDEGGGSGTLGGSGIPSSVNFGLICPRSSQGAVTGRGFYLCQLGLLALL